MVEPRVRAWRGTITVGRGIRRNHLEDYAEYVRGSNIASFDMLPGGAQQSGGGGQTWVRSRNGSSG